MLGYQKGKSAIRIHREMLGRKKMFTNLHFWVNGYCVSALGLDEIMLREYIKNQEKLAQCYREAIFFR